MKINEKLLKTFLGFKNIILFIVLCTSCNAQNKKSKQIIDNGAELILISNDYEFTDFKMGSKNQFTI